MTRAKIEAIEIEIKEIEAEINVLKLELKNKTEEVNAPQGQIAELKRDLAKKLVEKDACDKAIANYLPQAVAILNSQGVEVSFDELVNSKEQVFAVIDEQITSLKEKIEAAQPKANAIDNVVLNNLLTSIAKTMDIRKDFPRKEIEHAIGFSGLMPKGTKKPFEFLLSLIGGDIKDYGILKKAADERETLKATISRKQTAIDNEAKNNPLNNLQETLGLLEEKQQALISTYEGKNSLIEEIASISSAIKDIEPEAEDFEITYLSKMDALRAKHYQLSLERDKYIFSEEKAKRGLLANVLINFLEEYKAARGAKYKAKDLFSAKDKKERDEFILLIEEELRNFVDSGDASIVIQTLRNTINDPDKFKGNQFKPTLNKMLVAFQDVGRENEDIFSLQLEGAFIVAQLSKNAANHPYIEQIGKLTKAIENIKKYANTLLGEEKNLIADFVLNLQVDIERFIIANPDQVPSPSSFREFKKEFTARLHSANGDMIKHKDWEPLITAANASLFLLGSQASITVANSQDTTFSEVAAVPNVIEIVEQQSNSL